MRGITNLGPTSVRTTTRSRAGRRLAALLTSALAVGGMVVLAPAPAAHADETVTSSAITWGFKSGFRNYVGGQLGSSTPAPVGQRVVMTPPATFDDTVNQAEATTVAEAKRPYVFPGTSGTVASATDITVPTTGGVTYNFPDHNFKVELKNLKVVVAGSTATLYADTDYEAEDGGGFEGGDVETTQVALATSSNLTVDVQDASATVSATNVTMTAAGAAAVPLYDAGEVLDNFSVATNQSDAPTITVSQTEVSPNGSTLVTVTGKFFDPAGSIGTRPPLSGQQAGVYVAFGKFNPVWKPSLGSATAPSSARSTGTTQAGGLKWAVPAAAVNTVGGAAGGAVLLSPEGSFTAKIRISKAQIDTIAAATPTNTQYGIYTYGGSGASAPTQETYTPITFSSASTNVALNSAAYTGTQGTPVPVTATVTGTEAGTPTGNVQLVTFGGDGVETVADTKALVDGAATFNLPDTAGTGALIVRYAGDGTFPAADSSASTYALKVNSQVAFSSSAYAPVAGSTTPFTVTVTKPATVAAPTGNVVVTYTPQGGSPTAVGTVNLTAGMNGVAAFTLPALTKGDTGTIAASYAGNANYAAAAATNASYTAVGSAPTVGLDKSHYAGPAGEDIPVVVTVAGVEGKATPTGTVSLTHAPGSGTGGGTVGPIALVDGSATLNLPDTIAVGEGDFQVTYSGDGLYTTGSAMATYEVGKNASTVSLDKASYNGAAGATIPVEVTVAGVEGQPTPTGSATLTYTPAGGTEQTVTAVDLINGVATVTLPNTLIGGSAGSLTVSYSGDASYSVSSKGSTYTVGQATPTLVLDKSAYTGTTGAAVPVVVTVNGPVGQPTPTGSVVLTYTPTGGSAVALPAVDLTAGAATVNLPNTVGAGTGVISVAYSGSATYLTDAETATYSLAKKSTAITVAGPASVAYRTAATYTATLTNGATGQVKITGAGVTYLRTIVNGKATFVLPTTLPAGARTLKFEYAGDASTNAATAVNKAVTIARGASSVTAAVTSKWTAVKNGALRVIVTSVKGGPVPVGKVKVSLKKGSVTKNLTAKVLSNGRVVFTLPKSAKGSWLVRVTYLGSTQHAPVTRSWTVTVRAR